MTGLDRHDDQPPLEGRPRRRLPDWRDSPWPALLRLLLYAWFVLLILSAGAATGAWGVAAGVGVVIVWCLAEIFVVKAVARLRSVAGSRDDRLRDD